MESMVSLYSPFLYLDWISSSSKSFKVVFATFADVLAFAFYFEFAAAVSSFEEDAAGVGVVVVLSAFVSFESAPSIIVFADSSKFGSVASSSAVSNMRFADVVAYTKKN